MGGSEWVERVGRGGAAGSGPTIVRDGGGEGEGRGKDIEPQRAQREPRKSEERFGQAVGFVLWPRYSQGASADSLLLCDSVSG